MNPSVAFLARPTTKSQSDALLAFMRALDIRFDVQETTSDYDTAFVDRVLECRQQVVSGRTQKIQKDEISSLLGL